MDHPISPSNAVSSSTTTSNSNPYFHLPYYFSVHPMSASLLTVNMSAEQSTAVQAQGLRIIVAKMVEVNGEEEYNIVFQSGNRFNVIATPCDR